MIYSCLPSQKRPGNGRRGAVTSEGLSSAEEFRPGEFPFEGCRPLCSRLLYRYPVPVPFVLIGLRLPTRQYSEGCEGLDSSRDGARRQRLRVTLRILSTGWLPPPLPPLPTRCRSPPSRYARFNSRPAAVARPSAASAVFRRCPEPPTFPPSTREVPRLQQGRFRTL